MPQTAAHAMKCLRLPIAGGWQAIFGKHGCRILLVTRPSQGTCRSRASSPANSAQLHPWPRGTSVLAAPRGSCPIKGATACPITMFGRALQLPPELGWWMAQDGPGVPGDGKSMEN